MVIMPGCLLYDNSKARPAWTTVQKLDLPERAVIQTMNEVYAAHSVELARVSVRRNRRSRQENTVPQHTNSEACKYENMVTLVTVPHAIKNDITVLFRKMMFNNVAGLVEHGLGLC